MVGAELVDLIVVLVELVEELVVLAEVVGLVVVLVEEMVVLDGALVVTCWVVVLSLFVDGVLSFTVAGTACLLKRTKLVSGVYPW